MTTLQVSSLLPRAGEERAPKLSGRVVPFGELGPPMADRLYELFARHYRHVDRPSFDRDQAEKDWVLLLADAAGAVQGFTTLKLYDVEFCGQRLRAVFSGNTIIEPGYWGEQALVRSWCRFMAGLKRALRVVLLDWS